MDYFYQLNNLFVLLDDNEKNSILQLFSQYDPSANDSMQDGEIEEHQFHEFMDDEGVEETGERNVDK